jgi:hypothetical protein
MSQQQQQAAADIYSSSRQPTAEQADLMLAWLEWLTIGQQDKRQDSSPEGR